MTNGHGNVSDAQVLEVFVVDRGSKVNRSRVNHADPIYPQGAYRLEIIIYKRPVEK